MTIEHMMTLVLAAAGLLYLGLCLAVIFICGSGALGPLRGRTVVFLALLEFAMGVVGLVGVGGSFIQSTESVILTIVVAYVYLVFVFLRLKDQIRTKFQAMGAPVAEPVSGIV